MQQNNDGRTLRAGILIMQMNTIDVDVVGWRDAIACFKHCPAGIRGVGPDAAAEQARSQKDEDRHEGVSHQDWVADLRRAVSV